MGIQERKQREREQRRQRIIDSAFEVVMSKGISNLTMDDTAAVAELSKATLYLYFKSKEELIIEIVIQVLHHFATYMEVGMKGLEPREALARMGETYLKYYYSFPVHYKILNFRDNTQELEYSRYENSQRLLEANCRIWDVICAPLIAGIQEGIFRSDIVPLELGVIMWASGSGIISLIDHFRNAPHHRNDSLGQPQANCMQNMMNIDFEKLLFKQWDAIAEYIKK